MSKVDLECFRGDTKTYLFHFKDSLGNAINITGASLFFSVKSGETDLDAVAKITKTVTSHTSPTTGDTRVSISAVETNLSVGEYFYDFQLKDTSGNIATFMYGKFKVLQDITTKTT